MSFQYENVIKAKMRMLLINCFQIERGRSFLNGPKRKEYQEYYVNNNGVGSVVKGSSKARLSPEIQKSPGRDLHLA